MENQVVIERWEPIPGYEGHYYASDLGRIKSYKCGKVTYLKFGLDGNGTGYNYVILTLDKKRRNIKVHRAVMLAFHGYKDMDVDHINGDTRDNRLENLEYVTHRENVRRGRTSAKSGRVWPLGVSKRHKKFRAHCSYKGQKFNLGTYDTPEEAHDAYLFGTSNWII